MPLILGTNSIKDTGYEVANSLRFDSGSSDNLSRTKGTSDSTKIGTYSWWIKNSKFTGQNLIDNGSAFNDSASVYIDSNSCLQVFAKIGGTTKININTDRVFRDPSAWYHIVVAIDTTQSTSSNRVKIYVNGTQETSFTTATYPDQNDEPRFFTSSDIEKISATSYETGGFSSGYYCEVVKVDGSQLDATSFGEFDSDSPTIWKPIDVSGLTFGTNGFYLDFENSGSLGADVSGNSNNFTVNNLTSVDQSTDTCTNNFATLNPLKRLGTTSTSFEEGNLQFHTTTTSWGNTSSTLAFTKGKWYAEVKIMNLVSTTGYGSVGISDINLSDYNGNDTVIKQDAETAGVALDHRSGQSDIRSGTSVVTSNIGNFSNNDIVGLAVDMDNKALYIHLNGTYYQISGVTGVPTSGSSKTGAVTIPASVVDCAFHAGSYTSDADVGYNFGSPFYSISSGNSDANGYGNFEYSVPSGYYALNTKNLAEYG